MGQITFYAENGCTGELGVITDTPGQWIDLQDQNETGIQNQAIRSCKFSDVRAETVLRAYESAIGDTSLDWAQITIKKKVPTILLPTFEHSMEDEVIKLEYFERQGLDGNISLLEID